MRVISLKAGRRYWLLILDGCEIGTNVPVSQPVNRQCVWRRVVFLVRSSMHPSTPSLSSLPLLSDKTSLSRDLLITAPMIAGLCERQEALSI